MLFQIQLVPSILYVHLVRSRAISMIYNLRLKMILYEMILTLGIDS